MLLEEDVDIACSDNMHYKWFKKNSAFDFTHVKEMRFGCITSSLVFKNWT
jgi:hypothetical protein